MCTGRTRVPEERAGVAIGESVVRCTRDPRILEMQWKDRQEEQQRWNQGCQSLEDKQHQGRDSSPLGESRKPGVNARYWTLSDFHCWSLVLL